MRFIAYRLKAYGIELNGQAANYQKSLLTWPLFVEAIAEAKSWNTVS